MKYQNSRVMLYAGTLNKKLSELSKIKFVKDTFTLQIGTAVKIGLSTIISILLARILKPSGYGTYGLVFSIYGFISILGDVGVGYSTLNRFSKAYARGDRKEAIELLAFFIKISIITTAFILMLGLLGAPYLASKLYNNPEIGNLARLLFLMAPLGIIYTMVATVLQSVRMMKRLTILESIKSFIISLLVIGFVLTGLEITGVVYGYVLATLLSSTIGLLVYFKLHMQLGDTLPSFKEVLKRVPRIGIRKYFSLGFLISVNKNIEKLISNLPILILGAFAAVEGVGYFKIAASAAGFLPTFIETISSNMGSKLPESVGKGDIEGFRNNFIKVSLYAGCISLGCTIVFIFIAPYLVIYLYGIEYTPAVKLIYVLGIYAGVWGFRVGLDPFYRTIERVDLTIKINSLLFIILIPIGLILVKYFKATGAALFVSSWYALSTFISFYIALKILKRPERWGKVIKESCV